MGEPKRWFFVMRLRPDHSRPFPDAEIQVQLLDEDGLSKEKGYLSGNGMELSLGGQRVPNAVVDAARRQVPGRGEYVDESGARVDPLSWNL